MNLVKGTVRWFNNTAGYGFILDESGKEIFVHYSAIRQSGFRSLRDGQLVEFERGFGPKGEHAVVVIPMAAGMNGFEGSQPGHSA